MVKKFSKHSKYDDWFSAFGSFNVERESYAGSREALDKSEQTGILFLNVSNRDGGTHLSARNTARVPLLYTPLWVTHLGTFPRL